MGSLRINRLKTCKLTKKMRKICIYHKLLFSFYSLFTAIKPRRLRHKHARENKDCNNYIVKKCQKEHPKSPI